MQSSPTSTRPDLVNLLQLRRKIAAVTNDNIAIKKAMELKAYKKFYEALQAMIYKQIMHFTDEDRISHITTMLKAATPQVQQTVNGYFLAINLNELSDFDLEEYLIEVANISGQVALDTLGVQATFGLTDPRVLAFLKNHQNLMIRSVDETTKKWIADTIYQGKQDSLTVREIADLISSKAEDISKARAQVIAFTETANAVNQVETTTYKENGVTQWSWATKGINVCELCIENESAGIVAVGTAFPSGDTEPPAHPSCACSLDPVKDDAYFAQLWTGGK
jgi:hypothetical protein